MALNASRVSVESPEEVTWLSSAPFRKDFVPGENRASATSRLNVTIGSSDSLAEQSFRSMGWTSIGPSFQDSGLKSFLSMTVQEQVEGHMGPETCGKGWRNLTPERPLECGTSVTSKESDLGDRLRGCLPSKGRPERMGRAIILARSCSGQDYGT